MNLVAEQQAQEPSARTVIVSLEESIDIDSTALDALLELDVDLKARGVTLRLARAHDAIRDLLHAAGAAELASRCSYSVDDAVDAAQAEGLGRTS